MLYKQSIKLYLIMLEYINDYKLTKKICALRSQLVFVFFAY